MNLDLFGNPIPQASIGGPQGYLMDTRPDAHPTESAKLAKLRAAATKDAPVLLDPPKQPRNFYKCQDCLTVAAIDRSHDRYAKLPTCSLCGATCEHMGEVKGDKYVKHHVRCACDERCTHARGPSCDCSCKGENHGIGAVVEYDTVEGTVSRLNMRPNHHALANVTEYRAAIAPLIARRQELNDRKRIERLSGAEYNELCELYRIICRAQSYKTHAPRMELLTKYAAKKAA